MRQLKEIEESYLSIKDPQKSLTFVTTAVLKKTDEILTTSTESRSLDLRQVMGYSMASITLLGRVHKQISNEQKERLKPVLIEDIRGLCDKDTTSSEYLFGKILSKV